MINDLIEFFSAPFPLFFLILIIGVLGFMAWTERNNP